MLPFGSILTQLPLLIIGAMYMLYVGLLAVNKSKHLYESHFQENKEQSALLKTGDENPDIFSLVQVQNYNTDFIAEDKTGLANITSFRIIPYNIYLRDPVKRYCDFLLFSRPPPCAI